MTTDFRALCAELLAHAERAQSVAAQDLWFGDEDDGLFDRARAALAEAAPEGREPASVVGEPTYDDLSELCSQHGLDVDSWPLEKFDALWETARAVLARWGNPAPQVNPWKETLIDALVCNFLLNTENKDNPKKALNDLIAWEKQLATDPLINFTPQPVPVNERLPGPKDCDEEGRCWWWQPSHPEGGYLEGWMLRPRFWGVGHYDLDDRLTHTHWLPAHAIPLPTVND